MSVQEATANQQPHRPRLTDPPRASSHHSHLHCPQEDAKHIEIAKAVMQLLQGKEHPCVSARGHCKLATPPASPSESSQGVLPSQSSSLFSEEMAKHIEITSVGSAITHQGESSPRLHVSDMSRDPSRDTPPASLPGSPRGLFRRSHLFFGNAEKVKPTETDPLRRAFGSMGTSHPAHPREWREWREWRPTAG